MDQLVNLHNILLCCRIYRDMYLKESSGKIREIEGKCIAGRPLSIAARTCQEKEKKEEKEKTKQETHHTTESECSALNFPRENHLIPQPRFLFPQTGMKYLFAYASPGLTAVSELPAR